MHQVLNCKAALKSPEIQAYLNESNRWWSYYIFHFSHVQNIASILNNGKLYSREKLEKLGLTDINDNASSDVINGTDEKYKDYVRFYFRPLTPTQYHNEGIRATAEITELNAHCPVPVFLLFDTAILDEHYTKFSYESLASHYHVNLYSGSAELLQAPFHHIYHNESTYGLDGNLIRKRRHAEIVVKHECSLHHLKKIVCRTDAEARTLRHLLNKQAFNKYEHMICIVGIDEFDTLNPNTIFRNNYLQIVSTTLRTSEFELKFNKPCIYPRELNIVFKDSQNNQICYAENKKFIVTDSKTYKIIELDKFLNDKKVVFIEITMDNRLVFKNKYTR